MTNDNAADEAEVEQAIADAVAAIKAGPLPAPNTRALFPRVEGFFTDCEGVALARLCRDATLLEVGSWKGRSTVFAATGGAARIVCVDTWQGDTYTGPGNFWPEFRTNVDTYTAPGRVVPVVGRFQAVLDYVNVAAFDVLHYDADHDDQPTVAALEVFAARCSPDAVIVCHDANYPNVRRIVDGVAADMGRAVSIVDRLAILWPDAAYNCKRFDDVRGAP